jgi:hypothetical protein
MEKFVLLANPRTGSSLMMDCLSQHKNLKIVDSTGGELFNYDYSYLDNKMFDFDLEDLVLRDDGILLTEESHKFICRKKYCETAHTMYDGYKLLTCHIKNDVEEYLSLVKVIYLYRKNLLAEQVSAIVAIKTGLWFNGNPFEETIVVDPIEVEHSIDFVIKRRRHFCNMNLDKITIAYEDNLQDNMNDICNFLDIKVFQPQVRTKQRIQRPLNEVISNYDEVKHLDKEYNI